jgi:hypothetical protein
MTTRIPQREVNLARELSRTGLRLIQFSNELLAQDATKRPTSDGETQAIESAVMDLVIYLRAYRNKYGRRA